MRTILTTEEAITFGPGDAHLSGAKLADHIRTQEEKLANERFGWDFYKDLVADLYEYRLRTGASPAQSGTVRYFYYENQNRTDIVAGDFVLAGDVVYRAKIDVTQAGIQVANIDYYERAAKFATADNEELYLRYLRGILALSVARTSVVSSTFRQTSRGGVKQYEEGKSVSLSAGELSILKSEYQTDIEDMIANMERFILRSGGKYATYGKLQAGTACDGTETDELITSRSGAGARARNYGFTLPGSNNSIR